MWTQAPRPETNTEAGFSLIELLVSTAVAVILMGGLYQALFFSQATQEAQMDITDLRQQARVVANQMVDELRMTGYDMGSAPVAIDYAGDQAIAFVADIDDGAPTPPCGNAAETAPGGGAERVSYALMGTNLVNSVDCRIAGGVWSSEWSNRVVATNVQGPIFRYFDEDGNQLIGGMGVLTVAQRDLVRVVEIRLRFTDPDVQVIGDPNVDFELNTSVRLRNVGF